MPHSPLGSQWNRWDLHFHTPSSFDYKNKGATDAELVQSLIDAGVKAVVVTDHHVIDVNRIQSMQQIAKDRLVVFPGIELRSELGGRESVHFIGIFPETCDLPEIWNKLSAKLEISAADVRRKGDEHVYCDLVESSKIIRELGGLVTIHGHGKSNSIEGIANVPAFKAQLKTDLLTDHVDILEVGKSDRQEDYTKTVFPAVGVRLPLILCSDNHDCRTYAPTDSCWLRCDLSFRGLKMVLVEPEDRVFIGQVPEELVRVEQAKSKYIKSLAFVPRAKGNPGWFDGTIEFNTGLIAIIGNKGSGKSALADTLGLLGHTKASAHFSFLNDKRFKNPISGRAEDFSGNLIWHTGNSNTLCLSDQVPAGSVELVKYLPQSYIEEICNEINGVGPSAFERELKSVIFSHVPEAERLGQKTLDDLIDFKTAEKERRIDGLIKDLREISRQRARLEDQQRPAIKTELANRLGILSKDLEALEASKPVIAPQVPDQSEANEALAKAVEEAEKAVQDLQQKREIADVQLKTLQRKLAVAKLLQEQIGNAEREFAAIQGNIREHTSELGLDPEAILSLKIDKTPLDKIVNDATSAVASIRFEIDGDHSESLVKRLTVATDTLAAARTKLSEPARLYQESIAKLAAWQKKKDALIGTPASSEETILGVKERLKELEAAPEKIKTLRSRQAEIAQEVHRQKLEQADVFKTLYGPVQTFIDTHEISEKLGLEFRVELVNAGFTDQFLSLISQNRKGSYMGVEEGRSRSEVLAKMTDWQNEASVELFLEKADQSLHTDVKSGSEVFLGDQVASGRKPEDIYDHLYSLQYLRPRYLLRWEGKDLALLSPGERGTLLLTFYLLIDQGDMPLIIDQPEGNLDNHTVTKVLVDCIRAAKRRRQVFIVTHNPNLAVVCDADQIIHASMDIAAGNAITYKSGALENPDIGLNVTDVLEGTRKAFNVRGGKYDVSS